MIQIPPGFDVSAFAADFFALGALLVGVASVFTVWRVLKKAGNNL